MPSPCDDVAGCGEPPPVDQPRVHGKAKHRQFTPGRVGPHYDRFADPSPGWFRASGRHHRPRSCLRCWAGLFGVSRRRPTPTWVVVSSAVSERRTPLISPNRTNCQSTDGELWTAHPAGGQSVGGRRRRCQPAFMDQTPSDETQPPVPLPCRPRVLPGLAVLRRDDHEVQIGIDPRYGVLLDNLSEGLIDLLPAMTGEATVPELLARFTDERSRQAAVAVRGEGRLSVAIACLLAASGVGWIDFGAGGQVRAEDTGTGYLDTDV